MIKKMFICSYSSDFILGGIESYYIRMFQWAAENGYENMLVIPKNKCVSEDWTEDIENARVKVAFYNKVSKKNSLINKAGKAIQIDSERIGVAVVADISSYIKMQRLKQKYNLKKVKIILYMFLPEFCRASKKKWLNFPYKSVVTKLFESSMIFMDEETKHYCEQFYGCNISEKQIVRLGLQVGEIPSDIVEKREKTRIKEFNIITVTRLEFPFKAYVLGLIDEYIKLKDVYPFIKLFILGDGDGKDRLKEKVLTVDEQKRKDIYFLGSVPYNELSYHFEKSQLYIGMGTTLLDAGLSGLPGIIAKAYSENAMTTGFIYEEYNNLSGNEKINKKKLMSCRELIEKVINFSKEEYILAERASYNIVLKYYNIENNMKKILEIQDDVKICKSKIIFLDYYGEILRKIQGKFK